jgi:hypothetical protein
VNAFDPQVAIDQTGDAVAIWIRSSSGHDRVQAATRPPGGSFGAPESLSYWNLDASQPRVAIDQSGNAVAIWRARDGSNSMVQSSSLNDVNVPGYPRPSGGAKLRVPLTIAYAACTAPNETHGPALQNPSCNPPVQSSAYLTTGTRDANGHDPQMVGSVKYTVDCNPPAPGNAPPCSDPGDQADVRLALSVTDVRNRSDLSDYTGELEAETTIRTTDRQNGSLEQDPGTTTDIQFAFTALCAATSTGDTGGSCSVTTHADTVAPGAVVEGKRANWELGKVQIYDGGSDGRASTAGNTLFAVQGILIP